MKDVLIRFRSARAPPTFAAKVRFASSNLVVRSRKMQEGAHLRVGPFRA